MKHIFYTFACCLLLFTGCKKEDALTSLGSDDDYFTAHGTDSESEMRNSFYKATGVYLLFSEVLKNSSGQEWILDLNYDMTSSTKKDYYKYDYLTSEDRVAATEWVKNYLMPSLGEKARPFSFLLTDKIHYRSQQDPPTYPIKEKRYAWGMRSSVIAVGAGIANKTEAELKALKTEVMPEIALQFSAKFDAQLMKSFYAVSAGSYETSLSSDEPTILGLGLLRYKNYSSFMGLRTRVTQSEDLYDYITRIFSMTETEFSAKYGAYPNIVKKRDIMIRTLNQFGIATN